MLHHVLFPADHHAVTAFQAPHAAAGAHIHVMDLLLREFLGAPNVVYVVGIPAIDNDVPGLQVRQQVGDRPVYSRGGNHQPHRTRFLESLHQVLK